MYKEVTQKSSKRDLILECIFRNAPISRTAIAQMTGITPAATTVACSLLLEEGLIVEVGEESTESIGAGRKRIALDICPTAGYTIGVEFGHVGVHACITNLKGQIICDFEEEYSDVLTEDTTRTILDAVSYLIETSKIEKEKLLGIGIAVPGHIDVKDGHMISHNIWQKFDPQEIRNSFSVPVVFENNVRCMALSQYLFNAKHTPDSFAFFHVGLGMFCASMIDGKLFLGNAYISGEIGHMIVNPNGVRCGCGKQGCLQTIASERWLIKNAKKLYHADPSCMLSHLVSSEDDITLDTIATAYSLGDEAISAYVSNALRYLGISTSNIAILMNPKKIFLHGKFFTYPEIRTELLNTIDSQLTFVESDYTSSVEVLPFTAFDGAIGGAALAILEGFLHISYL